MIEYAYLTSGPLLENRMHPISSLPGFLLQALVKQKYAQTQQCSAFSIHRHCTELVVSAKTWPTFFAMQPSRKNEHTVPHKASCARMETVSRCVRAESCLTVPQWKSALTHSILGQKQRFSAIANSGLHRIRDLLPGRGTLATNCNYCISHAIYLLNPIAVSSSLRYLS